MSHANPFCTYFVAFDPKKGTLTRYTHHKGTWGVKHLRTCQVDNPDVLREMGTEPARKMIEEFRVTGSVS